MTVGERVGRVVGALDLAVLDAVDDRAEALEGELLLALGAEHEVEPLLGLRGGVDQHRARVLDQHRGLRDDVVELLAVLVGEDGLVLVGHEHVAGAAEEGGGGVTAAARQRRRRCRRTRSTYVVGLGLGAAVLDDLAPGRQRVPAGRARRRRVRGHDLDAGLDQVVPGLDALGVARRGRRTPRSRSTRCPWSGRRPSPRRRGPRRPGGSRRWRPRSARSRPRGRDTTARLWSPEAP